MLPHKVTLLLASAAATVFSMANMAGAIGLPFKQQESDFFAGPSGAVAPLLSATDAELVDKSYIVVLKSNLTDEQLEQHHNLLSVFLAQHGGLVGEGGENQLRHVYEMTGLRGYAGKFSDELVERIRTVPEVDYIERDSIVYASTLQRNAPWGLARISHHKALTFRTYNKYPYDSHCRTDITAYIVDTGINIHHVDFKGRARWGATIPEGDEDVDGNGHGSHVAGTVGGSRYGVAKKANLVAVKVLRSNGSGTMSDVIRGVQWTIEDHQLQEAEAMRSKPRKPRASVANMSLGGGFSRALNMAVNAAVESGVHYAVAAGNDNRDACDYSPASAEKAITVGASNIGDERAWFSNFGKCTDVFAPGKDITSIWIGSNTATNTISGTSMASPHVAGLMAYLLSLEEQPEKMTCKALKEKIIETATKGVLENVGADSPNLLIYSSPPSNVDEDSAGLSRWVTWVREIADKIFITV